MTFWDPYLCLSDQAPDLDMDLALFDSDLQDANKKIIFFIYEVYMLLPFGRYIYIILQR